MKAEMTTHPSHYRSEEEKKTLPMPGNISLWKLDADSKYTDSKDDTGKFESDGIQCFLVAIRPTAGIEYASTIGSWVERRPIRVTLNVREWLHLPIMTPKRKAQQASPMYSWSDDEHHKGGGLFKLTFSRIKSENMPN